jgi:DNA modification methylase
METNKIIQGDCLEELKKLPDESVDAIITDPPAGIEFMGKEWDSFKDTGKSSLFHGTKEEGIQGVYGREKNFKVLPRFPDKNRDNFIQFIQEVMTECKRVLKSGGHCVVWALPRTSHWTTMAIENAGFEVRDVIHHIFNTGFPKSLNIGKAVDNKLGNERKIVGYIEPFGRENRNTSHTGGFMKENMKYKDEPDKRPIYDSYSEWEGFGTALKPACEHWILARKPLSEKTIVEQVLKNGCGGLDIDGCRIPIQETDDVIAKNPHTVSKGTENYDVNCYGKYNATTDNPKNHKDIALNSGRFPANCIVQDDALNDGTITKARSSYRKGSENKNMFGFEYKDTNECDFNDQGSKSRYFNIDLWAERNGILQIPKPSKSEKNKGCEDLEDVDWGPYRQDEWSRQNMGNTPDSKRKPVKNNHPTVKSIALMSWIIKLVSKEDDIVLDPFTGSGTTLVACQILNRKWIGIEKEEEYIKICHARINYYSRQRKLK